ncbi:MAG: MFS transporter [Betaproteobacteria bacterium]
MSARPDAASTPAPVKQAPPETAISPFAFVALSMAAFGSGISQRVTDPLLPRFSLEFGASLGAASWVVTIFTLAYGFNQLFFGPLGDRFGKYRVIAWACVACSFATLLCALAPDFRMLLAARFVAGAMLAAIIPLSMAWIGDVVPYEQRQPVLARFLIGQILGVSAGQMLGGLAADFLGWRVPFFLLTAGFAGVSMLLFAMQRRLPERAIAVAVAEGHAMQRMFREFGMVMKQPWARVVTLTVFLEGAFLYGAFAFIATHLHLAHSMSLSAAGTVVMLFGFGGFLFAGMSRHFVRRLGETGLAFWGGIAMFVSLFVIAFAPAWGWSVPACFIAGLGFYMLHNTLQTNATQMAPERRGAAVAAFAFCFFTGQSAGLALAGATTATIGTQGVIIGGAVGVLIVAMMFARLKANQRSAAAI